MTTTGGPANRSHPLGPRSSPPAERRAAGLEARDRMPRDLLGTWDPTARVSDAVDTLHEQNHDRLADLVPLRFERMAASPWNFYRGAAAVMAADLATRPNSGLNVQMCGDAHVLNFGLWATPERNLSFDLRDFDETLPGPFEWDLLRLAASLRVLARDTGLSERKAEAAVAQCIRSYREHIADYTTARQLEIWYDLVDVDRFVARFKPADRELANAYIARKAKRRTSRGAAKKLIEVVDGHLHITEEPPVRVHLGDDDLAMVADLYSGYRDSLPEYRRHLLDRFTIVDAVRQVVGVGSVGMRVFLVLLEGRDGADPLFLQIKQAAASVYEAHLGPSRYDTSGQRVAVGKRLIQSATDIFVGFASSSDGHDFYVRQFRDMKVIPDGALIAPRLAEFSGACGAVLARAHARSGDATSIAAYIGKGPKFDDAIGEFAVAYADQTERDHRQLAERLG